MEQGMTNAINTPVTSKPIREPSRELTENELAHVSGGIIAVLIGNSTGQFATAFHASRRL
jgi:bacteriocin-like protein